MNSIQSVSASAHSVQLSQVEGAWPQVGDVYLETLYLMGEEMDSFKETVVPVDEHYAQIALTF